jgi:hypothetical protein
MAISFFFFFFFPDANSFPSFEVGQHKFRIAADSPRTEFGIENLAVAGDWVRTSYPA